MKKLFKFIGYSLVALIALCVVVAIFGGKKSTPVADTESTDVKASTHVEVKHVTAAALFSAYDNNEVSADQKYKGASLSVSGTIQSIDKDAFDNIVIQFRTANEFMPVHAYLNKKYESLAANLTKGQKVTWLCDGDGRIIGSPVLRDCSPAN